MKPHFPMLLSVAVLTLGSTLHPLMAEEAPAPVAVKEDLTRYDRKFVREALEEGTAMVALGKLAAEKGGTEAVRQLGKQAATEHEKINAELQELAVKSKIPTSRGLDKDDARDYEKLSKLSGAAFDKKYLDEEIDDHEDAIERFQYGIMELTDPKLKEFAKKTLPVLQSHLQKIREIKRDLQPTE